MAWEDRVEDLARRLQAGADAGEQILDRGSLEDLDDTFHSLFGEFVAFLTEQLLKQRLAKIDILGTLLRPDKAANARPRLAGDDEAFPGRRRGLSFRREDLYLIAVLKLAA